MSIRVALHHRTSYRFDRPVRLSPQEIRLRPAPHCRTPILAYALSVTPERYIVDWQRDPNDNWVAWLVFTEPTTALDIVVDLTVDLALGGSSRLPLEPHAEMMPFAYAPALAAELAPFLVSSAPGPRLAAWIECFRAARDPGGKTVELLTRLNRQLNADITYLDRMGPGVQTPDETLEMCCGSCRDSGWLLVQILRQLGFAARFASGYLIQLVAGVQPDGRTGPERDFAELHAWAECFVPGAGWIGLDPTSGRLADHGHVPLACTADPVSAVAIVGYSDPCEADLSSAISIVRVHDEQPLTRSGADDEWKAVMAIGGSAYAGYPRERNDESLAPNASEADERWRERSAAQSHAPDPAKPGDGRNSDLPTTLDLRRRPWSRRR